jgi:hypothetical protein
VKEAVDAASMAIRTAGVKAKGGGQTGDQAEELYAEARAHLQRVGPDLYCGPHFIFELLRKTHDEVVAAIVASAERECERLCLEAHRALAARGETICG